MKEDIEDKLRRFNFLEYKNDSGTYRLEYDILFSRMFYRKLDGSIEFQQFTDFFEMTKVISKIENKWKQEGSTWVKAGEYNEEHETTLEKMFEKAENDSIPDDVDSIKLAAINKVKGKVKEILEELSCKLNQEINENYVPTFENPEGDGTPYIIMSKNGYNYIYSERGEDFLKKTTSDIDKLLFWIFKDIVSRIVDKRNKERKEWFKEEEDVLMKINSNWANLLKEEHRKILIIWR
jgi:flagellin-specific chaperone FliS